MQKYVTLWMDISKLALKVKPNRLELTVDGHVAFVQYETIKKTLVLIHTEVPKELEGKGVGKAIVEKTLEYAKANGFKIIPLCPFIKVYLKRHPEWNELLDVAAGGHS
jgi:predicted GNAT family acetyltransferase